MAAWKLNGPICAMVGPRSDYGEHKISIAGILNSRNRSILDRFLSLHRDSSMRKCDISFSARNVKIRTSPTETEMSSFWLQFRHCPLTISSAARYGIFVKMIFPFQGCDGLICGHYNDFIMCAMASRNTSLSIVNSTVYSETHQRKHQSSASLTFLRGIHRWPVNSRTKGQYRGKCFHLMKSSCGRFTPI